jgi:uncharacterized membrane protein YbhN (UPF0104 family)
MTSDTQDLHQPEEGLAPPPDLAKVGLRDFLGALLLIGLSLAFGVGALQMPYRTAMWVWYTSPGIFALAMAVALGLLSLAIACRGLRVWWKERRIDGGIAWRAELRQWGMGRFLTAVAMILAYLLVLGRVPFLLASVGLIMAMAVAFRDGRVIDAVRPAAIASLIIVMLLVLITKIFGTPFP